MPVDHVGLTNTHTHTRAASANWPAPRTTDIIPLPRRAYALGSHSVRPAMDVAANARDVKLIRIVCMSPRDHRHHMPSASPSPEDGALNAMRDAMR